MNKFCRRYVLAIEGESSAPSSQPQIKAALTSAFTITDPLTVQFSITRQCLGGNQEATFRIYNLAERTRNRLQKDYYQTDEFRAIQFKAGYDLDEDARGSLPIVFNGQVREAYSFRDGVDWVTEITAFDMGTMALSSYINETVGAGQTEQAILRHLSTKIKGSSAPAAVGKFPNTTKRATVLSGNVMDIIQSYVGHKTVTDNGRLLLLNDDEYLAGHDLTIDASSGLLGTPRRAAALLNVDLLFEPRATLYAMATIESDTMPEYNGDYKILSVKHDGIISGGVGGSCKTSLGLYFATAKLNPVK